jgi:GT2 family glycosyltransferase
VVIVTWNRRADVLRAIQSVYNQAWHPVEVIVVDNGSTDGTAEAITNAYPEVRLLRMKRNLGASGGRNPGIYAAQGEVIFLLDSDATLSNDTLARVVQRFAQDDRVGILTCKVLNAHTGDLDAWLFYEGSKADQDREFASYGLAEGASAVRRQVFERIGLFAPELIFGREGEEFSLRAWNAGFEVRYLPNAVVHHYASPQGRISDGHRQYFDLRNTLHIYLTLYPWWMLALFLPLKLASSVFKGWRRRHLPDVLRAIGDVAQETPGLVRNRRPIDDRVAWRYLGLLRDHGALSWDMRSWLRVKA